MVEGIVGVGAVDDLSKQHERRIFSEFVFFQYRFERAFLAMVTQLDVFDVVRDGAETFRFLRDPVGRDEDELGVLVDEFLDQPRTGDAIDLNPFARDPFHGLPPASA